jgi:hypothetical protein
VFIGDFQSTPQRFQAGSRIFAINPTDPLDASLAAGRQRCQKLSFLTIDCSAAIAVAQSSDWRKSLDVDAMPEASTKNAARNQRHRKNPS